MKKHVPVDVAVGVAVIAVVNVVGAVAVDAVSQCC